MKTRTYVTILFFLLTIGITNAYAGNNDDKNIPVKERVATMTDNEKNARLEEIRTRVNEIKDMDKSALSKDEKKALKKELREMKKEARVIHGGIYLSAGAIIVIILVLILVL